MKDTFLYLYTNIKKFAVKTRKDKSAEHCPQLKSKSSLK